MRKAVNDHKSRFLGLKVEKDTIKELHILDSHLDQVFIVFYAAVTMFLQYFYIEMGEDLGSLKFYQKIWINVSHMFGSLQLLLAILKSSNFFLILCSEIRKLTHTGNYSLIMVWVLTILISMCLFVAQILRVFVDFKKVNGKNGNDIFKICEELCTKGSDECLNLMIFKIPFDGTVDKNVKAIFWLLFVSIVFGVVNMGIYMKYAWEVYREKRSRYRQ